MRKVFILPIVLSALAISCNSNKPVSNIDWSNVDRVALINTMSEVFTRAADNVKPSVLYAEIISSGTGDRYDKTRPVNLFVFKPDGYLIMPGYLEPKDIGRVKVWVDETEYEAKFVDSDREEGVTVLKIQIDAPLKPITIGDASRILPGQYIITVNALGENAHFEKTGSASMVTGKIEAKNDLILTGAGVSRYSNYGDSGGGVTTNLDGEFVGMPYGGGVRTFNRLKQIAERLITRAGSKDKSIDTEENQPWEGFNCEELTKEFAEGWGYQPEGVMVRHVSKLSPAGKAGLKEGDIIIAVDGQPITKKAKRGFVQFEKMSQPEIGQAIKLTILRDISPTATAQTETKEISFTYDKRPKPKEFTADDIGLKVRGLVTEEYEDYDIPIRRGVLVQDVIDGSSAATSSSFREELISHGDVITEFYGVTVNNLDDFIKAVDKIRAEKPEVILVKLQRKNRSAHVCLNLKIGKRTEKEEE
jgi:serine protease Do